MKKYFSLLFFGTFFYLFFHLINKPAVAQTAPWFNSSWNFRQKIVIGKSMVANTNQTNFPVLITKTDNNLKNSVNGGFVGQDDGGDFVLTGSDGITKLDHEIERYYPTTGKIIVWVRIPNLSATVDTTLYLYYGNQNCSNQWNKTGVWDSNYLAVYHLNETSGQHLDSTINGKNSTLVSVLKQGADIGIIGPADEFNGTSSKINLPAIAFAGNKATLEGWTKSDVTTGNHRILSRYYSQQMIGSYNGQWATYVNPGGFDAVSGGAMNTAWHYIAGTYDGSLTSLNLKLYRDGVLADTSKGSGNITNDTVAWEIGAGGYWDGIIDEVRISKIPRSADWIKTGYFNQSSPSAYLTFNNQENLSGLPQPTQTPSPTPIITLTPTNTPTPTATPTINPTDWNYKISVPVADYQDYGFSYPGTYIFSLPAETTTASVYKKHLLSANWTILPEKTSNDFFNGIEAVRFDYSAGKAYVSVAFSDLSQDIYLRFVDNTGNKITVNYLGMPQYYDNRKATVIFSADDWTAYYAYPQFITSANIFQEKQIWLTVGLVTGEYFPTAWAGVQTELNEGYLEPASHSRSHNNIPYADYDSEVGGSAQDIKNNLVLPPLNRNGNNEYVYTWIEPFCEFDSILRQKVGQYKYLTDRNEVGNTAFSAWDSANNTYGQAYISIWIDSSINNNLTYINSVFDQAYQNGGIYHATFHPAGMDWSPNKYAYQHLDYVKGRKDVWYAGMGHLYVYHFIQERNKVSVTPAN